MNPTLEPLAPTQSEPGPEAPGPVITRTHLDTRGVALAVDLVVCRPLEWATFRGRQDQAWTVLTVADRIVAWRALEAVERPPTRPMDRVPECPEAGVRGPLPELAVWPLVERLGKVTGYHAIMARAAWEALPVGSRPAGVWSQDGGHLSYQRPA